MCCPPPPQALIGAEIDRTAFLKLDTAELSALCTHALGALSPKLWLLSPRLHGCATARSALLGVLQLLLRGLGALDGGARRLRSW